MKRETGMTLSIPIKRGLVFLPVILLSAYFAIGQLHPEIHQFVVIALLLSIPVSPLLSVIGLILLWKQETAGVRQTLLGVFIVEFILVVLFVYFYIQFLNALDNAIWNFD